jgi:hypothetical protein
MSDKKISSEGLATLIVDALVDAGLVRKEDSESAVRVTTEEINVRKALQDY